VGKHCDRMIEVRTDSERFHSLTTGLATKFDTLGFDLLCGIVGFHEIGLWNHNRERGLLPLNRAIWTGKVVTHSRGRGMIPLGCADSPRRRDDIARLLQPPSSDRARFSIMWEVAS